MRRTPGIFVLVAITTAVASPASAAVREPTRVTVTVDARQEGATGKTTLWVNAADPALSRIIGTESDDSGLLVRDLTGREIQSIDGRFSEVALVAKFPLTKSTTADLAVVTDRASGSLRVYRIEATGRLTDVTADSVPAIAFGDQDQVKALAGPYLVVSGGARLGMVRLQAAEGKVGYRVTDSFGLPRPEATIDDVTVDTEAGAVYADQAGVAVWRVGIEGDRFAAVPRAVRHANVLSSRGA